MVKGPEEGAINVFMRKQNLQCSWSRTSCRLAICDEFSKSLSDMFPDIALTKSIELERQKFHKS